MDLEQKTAQMRQAILAADRDQLIFNDFQKALPALRGTELYKIFFAMPKGRLMHAHIEASFDLRRSLQMAFDSPDTYVFICEDPTDPRHCQVAYKASFEGGKVPEGWTKLSEALRERPGIGDEIFKMCTSDLENLDENIWPKFEAIFDRYKSINNYLPHFKKLYTGVFCDMAEEGIFGADFRFIGQSLFDEDGHHLQPDEYVDTVKAIEAEVRKKYPYFHVNLIYSYYKGVPLESVKPKLDYARHLAEKYPDVCIGFDMVGFEDCGKDLEYYAPVLKNAGVPVIMHAGETVDPGNQNIEHAMELELGRLGHGLDLYRHPEAEKTAKERGVMLEVCPLSNQLLGYVPDLRLHPAARYIRERLNVTISSDDSAIFDTTYLTDDMLLAYLCWDLNMDDVKFVIKNSLQGDKKLLELFDSRWEEFEKSL